MPSLSSLQIKSFLQTLLIQFLFSLAILSSFEGIARLYLYTKKAVFSSSLLPISQYRKNQLIAYDYQYSDRELSKLIHQTGDFLTYSPWTQFTNDDHYNKYSIVKANIRKTLSFPPCSGTKTVWFFGGSTTYGIGVPWYSSIPSHFQSIAHSKGFCTHALNFGTPFYYSRQESIYFYIKLFEHSSSKPDIVIFLDGLNDFGQPGSSINSAPFFTPQFRLVFSYIQHGQTFISYLLTNSVLFQLLATKFPTKSATSYYQVPSFTQPNSAYKVIASNYINNLKATAKLCSSYQIQCYHFLQPIPAISYTPARTENLTSWRYNLPLRQRYIQGYQYIKSRMPSFVGPNSHFYDLSSTFSNYIGIPYVDSGHYSPRSSRLVASSIFNHVSSSLR